MVLTSLKQIEQVSLQRPTRRVAIAAADDLPVLEAIRHASEAKMVVPILVGDEKKIREIATSINFSLDNIEIVPTCTPEESCKEAVSLVHQRKADILMKGLVATSTFLRAVIEKENGLLKGGNLLSHFSISEVVTYHKLIAVTDGAMNIAPDFNEKVKILNNAVNVLRNLGYDTPKVAVVSSVETVNPKIEATVHAAMLAMMNHRKQIKNCIVDGPLAIDNAISAEAAHHKGIESEVAGDADILLAPNLDAGNILYKALNFLSGAVTAAIITGAIAPIVLTSRADSEESKYYSIALASTMIK
jgi:phosphate butyryltransferase